MSPAPLRLKKHEDRRLRAGHVWIYSNEVDTAATPLTAFAAGDAVEIQSADGKPIGTGYVNPHSLICARLVSRDPEHLLDQSLLVHRFNIAQSLRARLFAQPYYRLAFGEADGLPGLVVDRYGDIFVVQISTAGMERMKDEIIAALQKVFRPRGILLRNDTTSRDLEGLPRYVETATGTVPERAPLEEHGARFTVPLIDGQKTGWFYDQRQNRARMRAYVHDQRVLDVFSYIGAWGVQAAAAGAQSVMCIDSSDKALSIARDNAAQNAVGDKMTFEHADAFDALRALRADRQRFDVVIVDPPAFIKRKKDLKEGIAAYRRLNQMAMQVLAKDGILISASCSYHLPRDTLVNLLLQTSRHVDRSLQLLEEGHQGPDHPVHAAIPETAYLKAFITRVLPS